MYSVALRKEYRLTQNQMGLLLGVDRLTISRWERGIRNGDNDVSLNPIQRCILDCLSDYTNPFRSAMVSNLDNLLCTRSLGAVLFSIFQMKHGRSFEVIGRKRYPTLDEIKQDYRKINECWDSSDCVSPESWEVRVPSALLEYLKWPIFFKDGVAIGQNDRLGWFYAIYACGVYWSELVDGWNVILEANKKEADSGPQRLIDGIRKAGKRVVHLREMEEIRSRGNVNKQA